MDTLALAIRLACQRTYKVECLRRPLADKWPRDDGNALRGGDMAILAVAKQVVGAVVRYRHDGLLWREWEVGGRRKGLGRKSGVV
jgi:hypothetical protein